MLTVTPMAAEVVAKVIDAHELPQSAGLRITSQTPDDGFAGHAYEVQIVTEPHPLDQVIDEGDAHVYVEAEAAPELDNAVLDAAVDGEQVAFTLERQDRTDGGG